MLMAGVLLALFSARFEAQSSIAGRWVWIGERGWQRITLDLTVSGNRLSGTIVMGPGSSSTNAEDWEYFFEPASYAITSGIITGNTISFDQVLPPLIAASRGAPSAQQTANRSAPILKYSGQIQNDSIIMTRESPARPNDAFSLGSHKFRFVLQRPGSAKRQALAGESRPPILADTKPPAVSLDVEVFNAAGAPVLSLTKDNFTIEEDGVVQPLQNVVPPGAPRNVLMMFDHNLTWLKGAGLDNSAVDVSKEWERVFQSMLGFLGRLQPKDRFAMGVFENTAKSVLEWRTLQDRRVPAQLGDVLMPPDGQKDVYGMVRWATTRFAKLEGRKSVIVFTDGRDGRLSPSWFRDFRQREVLDPLFGLVDEGEARELAEILNVVKQSGVKFHFIVINSDQDPEFGPAVVGRRISGLYPGTNAGIRDYLEGVRSRLKQLAEISGGRVLYGNTPQDASLLYRDLHQELGIGRVYTLEFVSGKPPDGNVRRLEASTNDKTLRLSQHQTGYIAQ